MNAWRAASRPLRAGVLALVVALVVGLVVVLWPGGPTKHLTAYFPRTVHLYPGSDVTVLGVKIGTVDDITPQGDEVRVRMSYDGKRKLPAGVHAVVLAPTIVADRVVQLTPPYGGGKVLADGAVLAMDRNQVPVELDQIFANLDQLAVALGPNGANSAGALSRLVQVGAANLDGQGENLHTTIQQLSKLMGTLGDNRGQLFDTVSQLQAFTDTLASHDADVRSFTGDLSQVSGQLDGEREELGAALHNLATALGAVSTFIHDNKDSIGADVDSLAQVTNVLAKERDILGRILDIAPVGIGNYTHVYNPTGGGFNGRFDFNDKTQTPALFICSLYQSVGGSPDECAKILAPLNNIPLPGSGSGSGAGSASGGVASDPTLGGILGSAGELLGGAR